MWGVLVNRLSKTSIDGPVGQLVPGLASIVIPSYNKARFIAKTLDSLAAQTHPDIEIVIVDDGSSDNSVSIIEDWLKNSPHHWSFLVHEKNQGVCRTLNDGLALARGEFVSALAADDQYLPHKTSKHVEMLQKDPEASFVYGDARLVDEAGATLAESLIASVYGGYTDSGLVFDSLLNTNFIPAVTVTMRRSALDQVGAYDESLPYEDYDMWLRLSRVGTLLFTGSVDTVYTEVAGSLSKQLGADRFLGHLRILSKYQGEPGVDQSRLDQLARREAKRAAMAGAEPGDRVSQIALLAQAANLYGGPWFGATTVVREIRNQAKARLKSGPRSPKNTA